MLDLYYKPGAASLVVHCLLEEAGLPYRLVRVSVQDGVVEPDGFAALNPHLRVPVLVEGGTVLTEAAAIAMQLADRAPGTGLAPAPGTDARAQWYRWHVYLTNTVQDTYMNYFHPERYTTDPDGFAAVEAKAVENLAFSRELLESHLAAHGPYLLGEACTSADLFLAMLTRWCRRLDAPWWDGPALGAHYRLVRARPAVARAWEQEGLEGEPGS